MTKDQLHAHLEALAELADLAQRNPPGPEFEL